MTSRIRSQSFSLHRDPESGLDSKENLKVKRHSTLYDAVAGRISAAGFIPHQPSISSTRDNQSSSYTAVPPEAVLFRKKNAPTRYEESDFYFASDSLPSGALPDSDLLKALHCYTSDFYLCTTADQGNGDWRSLDESALLALGILIEEVCRETLGEAGDMVFTEGELKGEERGKSDQRSSLKGKGIENVITKTEAHTRSGITRSKKRRRLAAEDSAELND